MGRFQRKKETPLIYFTPFEGFPTGEHFFEQDQKQPYPFWTLLREKVNNQGLNLSCVADLTAPPKGGSVILFHNMPPLSLLQIYRKSYSKEQLILFQWGPPVFDPLGHIAKCHPFFY